MGAADDAAAAAVAVFVMIAISFRHVGRRTCARLTRPSDVCKLSAVDSRLLLLPSFLYPFSLSTSAQRKKTLAKKAHTHTL